MVTEEELNRALYGIGFISLEKIANIQNIKHDERMNRTTPTMTDQHSTTADDGEPFHVFVVFGVVTMLSMTAVIVAIIAIIQNRNRILGLCRKSHHQTPDRRRFSAAARAGKSIEELPLHTIHTLHPVHGTQITEKLCKQTALKKIDSLGSGGEALEPLRSNGATFGATDEDATDTTTSTSGASRVRTNSSRSQGSVTFNIPTKVSNGSLKKQTLSTLHKSITSAMLEQLGEDSNSVLLLPLPYDHYTRDIISILKTILTAEGDIPSQCCFDPEVHSVYQKNKLKWIEDTLEDDNKIVIFVCLTTLPEDMKGDCIVYNLLNHCKIAQYRPSCHVVFLHLTDQIKDLENRYHGHDIHVKHENAFESFISAILQACGHSMDQDRTMLEHMLNSQATKHFFQKIGHAHR